MLIVGKNVPYAANGGTANTALTPDLLDVGSVGIYTIDATTGLFKLIAKGTVANTVSSTTVKTGFLKICQGLGGGDFFVSEYHDVKGIQSITASAYRVGSGETVYIGYDGTDQTKQIIVTPINIVNAFYLDKDEATIHIRERKPGNNEYGQSWYFSTPVLPTDTAETILNNLVPQVNTAYRLDLPQVATAALTGTTLPAVAGLTGVASAGNGLTTGVPLYYKVTIINANGETTGSNEVTVTPSSTNLQVTLDWPDTVGAASYNVYKGTASGVYTSKFNVANSNYIDNGTVGTASGNPPTTNTAYTAILGMSLTFLDATKNYAVNIQGVIENSPVSYVGKVNGSGVALDLQAVEFESDIYRGYLYTMSTVEKQPTKTIDISKTYDTFVLTSINVTDDKTGARAWTDTKIQTRAVFEHISSISGGTLHTNQILDFQQILLDIFPASQQLSY